MKTLTLGSMLCVSVVAGLLWQPRLSERAFEIRARLGQLGLPLLPATCTPTVNSASSLQSCINSAVRGDTISVPLGTYASATGFTLPGKAGTFTGTNYIVIQGAGPLSERRQAPGSLPRLEVTGSGVTLLTVANTTGWKLDGLELTNNLANPTTGANTTPAMVDFQVTASDMVVDRCVVHPKETPNVANNYMTTGRYAFNVGGNRLTVQRSYIYDFFGRDPADSQLQGVVAAQRVLGITNTNPTVITHSGTVETGDVVQVELAGGGLEGYFRPGNALTGDFMATKVDETHFSIPVNLVGADVWSSANPTVFYRWPRMSAIALGSPTTITMSQPHNMVTGQRVRPHGLQSSLGSLLNNNDYVVTVTSPTSFTITPNTTGLSIYSGAGGYYKAEGSAQQTIAFGIGPDVQDFNAINNFVQSWYAGMQTAGSDANPTVTTTVLANPAPTVSDIYVASTTGITAGMNIAVDTTHFDDPNKCPAGGQGGDRPCFAFGVVGSVNAETGQVHFSVPLKLKNAYGQLTTPTAAILSPGQVNVTGHNPTRINLYYNSLNMSFDFGAFHYATNGNTPKGVIEGKGCTDCVAEGNIIEGFPSTFAHTSANQNGSSPWMGTFNITIRNNWFKAYRTGILLSFIDYNARNTQGHTALVTNNLLSGGVGYTGDCIVLNSPARDVVITHNTCKGGYPSGQTSRFTGISSPTGNPYYATAYPAGIIYRDNLLDAGNYVAQCYDAGIGAPFKQCMTSPTLTYNIFAVTFPGSDPLSTFTDPSNKKLANWAAVLFVGSNPEELTDWAVQTTSPAYRTASDGTDRGVNITTLAEALARNDGYSGSTTTPTPSPTPVPTPSALPTPTPTPTPLPTPLPSPTPSIVKKVDWPKSEAEQDKILAAQWQLGYRLKRNLSGNYAEFEKVDK